MAEDGNSSFFALVSRMRYIDRWALMRNAREENLAEHSLDVAVIAHALCIIGNTRYGRQLDAERAAVLGLYHDVPEIVTGDLPTPLKYSSRRMHSAYGEAEDAAISELLDALPEDLRDSYESILRHPDDDPYLLRLVKAADKLAALIKCIDEAGSGNGEFRSAEASTRAALDEMAADLPEVSDFLAEFIPSYGETLDELLPR